MKVFKYKFVWENNILIWSNCLVRSELLCFVCMVSISLLARASQYCLLLWNLQVACSEWSHLIGSNSAQLQNKIRQCRMNSYEILIFHASTQLWSEKKRFQGFHHSARWKNYISHKKLHLSNLLRFSQRKYFNSIYKLPAREVCSLCM